MAPRASITVDHATEPHGNAAKHVVVFTDSVSGQSCYNVALEDPSYLAPRAWSLAHQMS